MPGRATTFDELIEKKALRTQVLFRVGAFELVTAWTAAGGGFSDTWKVTVEQRQTVHNYRTITSVTVAESAAATPEAIALVARESIADVDSELGSFYFDFETSVLYVSLDGAADPNDWCALIGFTLCFSNGNPDGGGRIFINEETDEAYHPYIIRAPSVAREIGDPFTGGVTTGSSTIELDASNGKYDTLFRKYIWHFGKVTILFGGEDLPLAEYRSRFIGSVTGKSWSDGVFALTVSDGCDPLAQEVCGAKFAADDFTDGVLYTGNGSRGFGHNVGSSSNIASFTVDGANDNINSTGTMLKVAQAGQYKPRPYGAVKGFSPPVVSMNATGATAQTAIVCLADAAYVSIQDVKVGKTNLGVSWWINANSGMLAVMLTLGTAGAARSIADGIQVDFNGLETIPGSGLLCHNPANVIEHMCRNLKASASTPAAIITSEDLTTGVAYSSVAGSLPGGFTLSPATVAPSDMQGIRVAPGDERPVLYGSQTNMPPQSWALTFVPNVLTSYYFDMIVCVGSSYVSVSAIEALKGASEATASWSSSNVGWMTNAASGLIYVRVVYSPATFFNQQLRITFTGPTAPASDAPTGETVPVGQTVALNTDKLDASETLCASYSITFVIVEPTVIRDVIARIARDTLSWFYIDNDGLLCFDTFDPDTTGEVDLTEETGFYTESPRVKEPSDRCYRTIFVEHGRDPSRRTNIEYLTVSATLPFSVGLLSGRVSDFTVQTIHSTSTTGAQLFADRLAMYMSRGNPVHGIKAPPRAMALDLGDKVAMYRSRLPVEEQGDPVHGYVTYIEFDLATGDVTLEVTENLISDLAGSW